MAQRSTIRQKQVCTAVGVTMICALVAGVGVRTSSDRNDPGPALRDAIRGSRARNVILFLGDGMGDSEITIARNYQAGARGRLWMDSLPFTGAYTTFALQ